MNLISTSKKFFLALSVVAAQLGCVANVGAGPQSNRDVMNRYFQLVDAKHPEALAEVEGSGLIYKLPLGSMDAATHGKVLMSFGVAFPNFKHAITRCVESGDLIACEGTFSGDQTGPLAMPDGSTLAPTKKHVEFPICAVARVQDRKFVEYDGYFDVQGFLGQLGVGGAAPSK
jgi:predicted ester cyclase